MLQVRLQVGEDATPDANHAMDSSLEADILKKIPQDPSKICVEDLELLTDG